VADRALVGGTHPQVTSPGQWDYALAADFIAAVDQLKVGGLAFTERGSLEIQ